MFFPNLLQVVLLLRKPLEVLEGATLAHESAEVHHVVACFVFQAVDAELIELVFDYLCCQVGNKVWMLLLR